MYDSSGFVAQNRWELAFSVLTRLSVNIGVTEGVCDDLDTNLACLGWRNLHIDALEGGIGFPDD